MLYVLAISALVLVGAFGYALAGGSPHLATYLALFLVGAYCGAIAAEEL